MITNALHPLRLKRLQMGLTQYALSELSGVAQVKISYVERGYKCLKDYQKKAIAGVLHCEVNELFEEEK